MLKGATRSSLYIDHNRTHVFIGHEAGLGGHHEHHQQDDTSHNEHPHQPDTLDEELHASFVLIDHGIEARIELFAETCREVVDFLSVLV